MNSLLLSVLAFGGAAQAIFNCKASFGDKSYDLSRLSALYTLDNTTSTPPSKTTDTWFINPCGTLSDLDKLPQLAKECPKGSQVCGVQQIALDNGDTVTSRIIPISGDFGQVNSGVKTSEIKSSQGGLHVELTGGQWGDFKDLETSIDFVCDKSRDTNPDLELLSWDGQTLQLSMRTKWACVDGRKDDGGNKDKDGDNKDKNGDKGKDGNNGNDKDKDKDGNNDDGKSGSTIGSFFYWVFILLLVGGIFMFIAQAYRNHQRYGLTGVDLLPNSDAIRDLPYLVRDFFRKIANTFSGGSSRGGYSAV